MSDRVQQGEPEVRLELPERLDEFRTALEEEIASAKRETFHRGISLVSGRRIAQVGASYQYAFNLENSLNLPGDTPGDLHVPNNRPVEVTIVAIDGMSILVSSPKDFGDYIARAKLVSDLTFLMRGLIERIEELAATTNPVGDRILTNSNLMGDPQSAYQEGLNRSQQDALASSLGRNLTYIWGPPGTGKTRTLGSIAYQLMRGGRSVLVVSHTNTAVDQALLKIADLADQEAARSGKILRVGEPHDKRLIDHPDLLLATHVSRRSERISTEVSNLFDELGRVKEAVLSLSRQFDLAEWYAASRDDLPRMKQMLEDSLRHEKSLAERKSQISDLSNQSPRWDQAKKDAGLTERTLQEITAVDSELVAAKQDLDALQIMNRRLSESMAGTEVLLAESLSVNWMIRRWRGLPSPDSQKILLKSLENESKILSRSVSVQTGSIKDLEARGTDLGRRHSHFVAKYGGEPDEVLRQELKFRVRLEKAQVGLEELTGRARKMRAEATQLFGERAKTLRSMDLIKNVYGSAEDMFESIEAAFSKARKLVGSVDVEKLRADVDTANDRVVEIEREIKTLQYLLARIEEVLISEADVIATTLTRAYLNDRVRARRYDTLILDEASMAPIPAVWVAASIADSNAVIAGDPEQLPPIVISSNEIAKKWLGRDVFEVSEVLSRSNGSLTQLNIQYRMEQSIASISNELIYGGSLTSAKDDLGDASFGTWFNSDWEHDHPVLLVDTGPLNAWVTSVPRGRGASRLNFLSATLCVDLCQILLKHAQSEWIRGDPYRIFIECPYRPHADLLRMLTNEYGLSNDVLTGTIHAFQGSEAEVVLLDLVNDEPHWRVALFIPNFDANNRRLLNVALTRARRKLIIVGDFDYIERSSRKAFIGRTLLPYLTQKFPRVSALDVIPEGILTRAAYASGLMSIGELEAETPRIVVNQDDFYPLFIRDINAARHRIVIYSPFMTIDRIGMLHVVLRSAVDRGVIVQIVTKTLEERGKTQVSSYRQIEKTLGNWGVVVRHKQRMHEKLVFVDDSILWEGSLNPLSFSDTQEHMDRSFSKTVSKQYATTLRLDELVGEYSFDSETCPICGSEIVASEGKDDPYYWRCVEDNCYTRSIGQARIEGGKVACFKCGGEVELGEWGGKTVWRCIENRRHRQRVARTHLRLPNMRARIPAERLAELDRVFGIKEGGAENDDVPSQLDLDV